MKNLLRVFLLCIVIASCRNEQKELQDSQTPTPTNPPNNGTTKKGTLDINVSWDSKYPQKSQNICFYAQVGIAYSSNDLSNEAYIKQTNLSAGYGTLRVHDLTPGIYYYKAKTVSLCGNLQTKVKSGSIQVVSGDNNAVNVSLY